MNVRYYVGATIVAGILTVLLAASTPVTAGTYDSLEFTAIVVDAADHADFLDIREIALAEPGDETVIVRLTLSGWTPTAGVQVDFFFTAGGTDFRTSTRADGTVAVYNGCTKDGTIAYCILPYETIKSDIGDKITATRAISYAGLAQDYAPGGLFVPDGLLTPLGAEYELKGFTPAPVVGAVAALEEFLISSDPAEATISPGSETVLAVSVENVGDADANYSLVADELPEGVTATFDAPEGSVGSGTVSISNLTVAVDSAVADGDYSFNISVAGPNGGNASITLPLTVRKESAGGSAPTTSAVPTTSQPTGEANGTAPSESGEPQETEASQAATPGLDALAILATLSIIVVASRRWK